MTLPKYTDPAVQNKTQDEGTDHIDELHQQPETPGKDKTAVKKERAYKEGNKDDNTTLQKEDDQDTDALDDDDLEQKKSSYGKRL